MLESGEFSSITDLAAAEKINHSYVRRILRLTLLSPEITEMMLNGNMPREWKLEDLLKANPEVWAEQGDGSGSHWRSALHQKWTLERR